MTWYDRLIVIIPFIFVIEMAFYLCKCDCGRQGKYTDGKYDISLKLLSWNLLSAACRQSGSCGETFGIFTVCSGVLRNAKLILKTTVSQKKKINRHHTAIVCNENLTNIKG